MESWLVLRIRSGSPFAAVKDPPARPTLQKWCIPGGKLNGHNSRNRRLFRQPTNWACGGYSFKQGIVRTSHELPVQRMGDASLPQETARDSQKGNIHLSSAKTTVRFVDGQARKSEVERCKYFARAPMGTPRSNVAYVVKALTCSGNGCHAPIEMKFCARFISRCAANTTGRPARRLTRVLDSWSLSGTLG